MKEIRDYTAMRLGSLTGRGRRIERCPECGRKGEAVTYRGGGRNFAHRAVLARLGGVNFGLWTVTDHCMIDREDLKGKT